MAKKFSFQDSNIPYLGSKKRQSSTLGSFIDPVRHKILVSPFAGGCSFELFAKHKLSMQILSNDWSLVAHMSQKSLLENNHQKIELNDIYYLFKENKNDGFTKKNYSKFFTDEVCDFLDTATENIRRLPESGYKKFLLSHLVVFYMLHISPYGKMGCTADIRGVRENGLENTMEEAVRTSDSRASKLLKSMQHPLAILKKLAERINAGVTNNNKDNPAYFEDAFSFLPKVERFSNEATLFADPPYFSSTSYQMYDPMSEILLGKKIETEPSVFNGKDVMKWYDKFFQLIEPYDLWLITMGARIDEPDAIHSEKFLEMARKHRPKAKLIKFENFSWSINSLSGKSPKECEEYLVVAEK
ncbi:MAG TPA: DNA adenine methylase [Candidatus Bathyarchaeia archaeon]|nr:DNA adenine methylase [Candidatus Bathyarchaeia archaeon]HLP47543.1 DNA adenine methylase [Candidatus Kapabacteria bacterium]